MPPKNELLSVDVAKVCNVIKEVAKKRGRGTILQIGTIVYKNNSPKFVPETVRLSCPATGRPIETSRPDFNSNIAKITCRGGCRADWFMGFNYLPASVQKEPIDSHRES